MAKSLRPNYVTKFTISNDSGVIAGCLNSLPLEQSLCPSLAFDLSNLTTELQQSSQQRPKREQEQRRSIRKSAENSGSEASASASI